MRLASSLFTVRYAGAPACCPANAISCHAICLPGCYAKKTRKDPFPNTIYGPMLQVKLRHLDHRWSLPALSLTKNGVVLPGGVRSRTAALRPTSDMEAVVASGKRWRQKIAYPRFESAGGPFYTSPEMMDKKRRPCIVDQTHEPQTPLSRDKGARVCSARSICAIRKPVGAFCSFYSIGRTRNTNRVSSIHPYRTEHTAHSRCKTDAPAPMHTIDQ